MNTSFEPPTIGAPVIRRVHCVLARDRTREVSDHARRIARHLQTRHCGRLRRYERHAGSVSVRDRETLDDGGPRMIGQFLDDLAGTLR